jgi:hypothetical protein
MAVIPPPTPLLAGICHLTLLMVHC